MDFKSLLKKGLSTYKEQQHKTHQPGHGHHHSHEHGHDEAFEDQGFSETEEHDEGGDEE